MIITMMHNAHLTNIKCKGLHKSVNNWQEKLHRLHWTVSLHGSDKQEHLMLHAYLQLHMSAGSSSQNSRLTDPLKPRQKNNTWIVLCFMVKAQWLNTSFSFGVKIFIPFQFPKQLQLHFKLTTFQNPILMIKLRWGLKSKFRILIITKDSPPLGRVYDACTIWA